MSVELQPYPEYRESEQPWLDTIPAHWNECRAKFLFREIDERSETGAEELLSVSHLTGVTPRSQKNITMFMAESYAGHKVCRPGDLVINTMWAWMAALGVSEYTGIVSPSYAVYRLRQASTYVPAFLDHLLRTHPFVAEYFCRSTGIRSSRLRLYPEQFLDMPVLQPPLEEQEQIVAFLAAKDREVRRFIRAKRRMIELLNEQKQIILESLVEGDSESSRTKLKHVVDLLPGFAFSSSGFTTNDADMRLLRGVNISPGRVRWDSTARWPHDDVERFSRYQLRAGDLVIGMDRPWISTGIRVASISEDDLPSLLLQRVGRLRAKPGLDQQYLQLLITGRGFKEYFEPILTGISVPHVSPEQILSYTAVIPTIVEQESIVRRFNEHSSSLETSIRLAQREIELIREYRTRLIADVVTGKLDVRGAKLPSLDTLDVTDEWDDEEAEPDAFDADEADNE